MISGNQIFNTFKSVSEAANVRPSFWPHSSTNPWNSGLTPTNTCSSISWVSGLWDTALFSVDPIRNFSAPFLSLMSSARISYWIMMLWPESLPQSPFPRQSWPLFSVFWILLLTHSLLTIPTCRGHRGYLGACSVHPPQLLTQPGNSVLYMKAPHFIWRENGSTPKN